MSLFRHILQRLLSAIVLMIGVIESVYGLMQLSGMTYSRHVAYIVTGHFYNPGPFGCFLAVMLPLGLWMMITVDNKLQKWLCMGMALVSAVLIPATLSRTAFAACCIGSIVALSPVVFARRVVAEKLRLIIPAIVAVGVLAAGAYFIKKDSADGRFLMWKVAVQAIMDTAPTGAGWANVAGAYGEAQERYFASGDGSEAEIMVADAPEYVFNEYLQVAIAYGPLAAVVMIAVIAGGVVVAARNRAFGFAGAGVAIMLVMSASYPLQFPLFVVTIGLIIAGCYLSARQIIVRIGGCAAVVMCCVMFYTHNQSVDVRDEFSVGHTLHRVGDFRKSNSHLLSLLSHSSDPMILNIIGKNYQSLGMPDSAEHYLMKSVNRCPNRLYPHYLLMNLYADSASYNQDKLLQEAVILINKKEKIPSPAVDEMRTKAREILETLK